MWSALRCRALRFVIDCDDGAALLALRDAERPFGVRVRCRRVTCWREGRAERRLRAEVTAAGGCSAAELSAWLSRCFAGCQDVWYIDGVPARAGAVPNASELRRLVALFAP